MTKAFDAMGRAAGRFSDRTQSAFNHAGRGARRFEDDTSSAFRNATKHGYNFMSIVKGILAANALRGGIGMIGSGAQRAAGDFLQIGDNVVGAIARFDDLGAASVRNSGIVSRVTHETRNAVLGTRHSAADAAKAVNELAKANYTSGSAMGMLRNMMDFATASQENLAEATTMSSDILGAFGLRSENIGKQTKNHIELNDMLTKASLLSTGGLRDLYETLQTIGPISKELRMGKEEVLALTTVLSNAGIKGTEAATAIKRLSTNIFAGNMREELEANGIFPFDKTTGQARKLTTLLGELSGKLAPLRDEQKLPVLKKLIGLYGIGGGFKLLQGFKEAAEFERKIADSKGISSDVAKAQDTSAFGRLLILRNSALEKTFQVLDAFESKGVRGFDALNERIKAFDVKPIVDGLTATGNVLSAAWMVLKPFVPAIPYIAGAWMAWNFALKAFAAIQVVTSILRVASALWGVNAALATGLTGAGALEVGLTALWGAMAPVVTGLAAIAAVGAVGVAGYSLLTGKDNFISKVAQNIGLVPKLETNADGVISGYAPNEKEAEARRIGTFMGRLDIAGAPPGSKITSKSSGTPGFDVQLLGVNP